MINPTKLMFLHGLKGSSQGAKANLLRGLFPGILIPDFSGSLEERMTVLHEYLGETNEWTIVGSSFGGLMGALFTCRQPSQVHKLVLLAPALIWPDFASSLPAPVDVPTIMIHGKCDELIPVETVTKLAEAVFRNLDLRIVDDDHGLYRTVHSLDWVKLLA